MTKQQQFMSYLIISSAIAIIIGSLTPLPFVFAQSNPLVPIDNSKNAGVPGPPGLSNDNNTTPGVPGPTGLSNDNNTTPGVPSVSAGNNTINYYGIYAKVIDQQQELIELLLDQQQELINFITNYSNMMDKDK